MTLQRAHEQLEQRFNETAAALRRANAFLQCEVQERQTVESQFKALSGRVVAAQEDERTRMARDIHDQIGQQMTALRLNLEAARLWARGDAARVSRAQRTEQLA